MLTWQLKKQFSLVDNSMIALITFGDLAPIKLYLKYKASKKLFLNSCRSRESYFNKDSAIC